ncbi:MAG TPA: hypothetical protein VLF40_06650 [Candidatus Saccharimonadales bacterium]|nr:hypothetical protein [Candidatus Saccharimonadales bacterium]
MLDELDKALETYGQSWQKLVDNRTNRGFFEGLKPVAVGWKVADRAEYDRLVAELHDQADKIIETWMNGRWVAKLHLKDAKLANGAELVKVLQRRPGSTDAVGLDHVDFFSPEVAGAEPILKQETDLKWTWESNDVIAGYDWISVWFDGTEAKLKSDTVLDIIQAELKELNAKLTA